MRGGPAFTLRNTVIVLIHSSSHGVSFLAIRKRLSPRSPSVAAVVAAVAAAVGDVGIQRSRVRIRFISFAAAALIDGTTRICVSTLYCMNRKPLAELHLLVFLEIYISARRQVRSFRYDVQLILEGTRKLSRTSTVLFSHVSS